MRHLTLGTSFTALLALVVACSSADPLVAAPDPPEAGAPDASCVEGETRCDGNALTRCESGVFAAPAPCEGETFCREGACLPPTELQLEQAQQLGGMLDYLRSEGGWHSPLDWASIGANGRASVLGGDGSDLAFFSALFTAFDAVPQGHQGLYLAEGCGKLVPYATYSQRGACGRPHPRGVVVTHVEANNPLGLKRGDLITRVGAARGRDLLVSLVERPMCAVSRPSASSRDTMTAASFTDLLRVGEEIEIESVDGGTRTATIDEPLTGRFQSMIACSDPFARAQVPVASEVRADGVAVIRLPGFTDPEQVFPQNPTQGELDAYRAAFEAKILAAFDAVKSAPAIVWDVRGNSGGLTLIGLGIASGFPGASADPISYCQARVPGSDPPSFDRFRYASYALTPGGPFAYTGKVAVLTDGLDYSAADYFPLAVKMRTDVKIFGAETAGAFGATSGSRLFDGPPAFQVSVDVNRCSSADGTPLEGAGVTPHVPVDYDPTDLSEGRDTVLERAVSSLK